MEIMSGGKDASRQPAFLPGYAWYMTHRCHRREFLLKFAEDRRRWRRRLFEATKRFGLRVLNSIVTSNHVHLLVLDRGEGGIARSIQLIAWTRALAVGGQQFVQRIQAEGGVRMLHRKVEKDAFGWQLREESEQCDSSPEMFRKQSRHQSSVVTFRVGWYA